MLELPHESIVGEMDFTPETIDALFWLGDHIPGGFFIYRADESQQLVYANRAVFSLYGCDSLEEFRELTGSTFQGMVHPDDYDKVQYSIDCQIDDGNNNLDYVEYRIIRKDGQVRRVDDFGHFASFPSYGDVYYVFISEAGGEMRQMREERVEMELALAREHQANEAKTAFLFNLSHDLCTPMNAIIGYLELAKRNLDEPVQLEAYLDRTEQSSYQLLRLIDDMLEMNRVSFGSTELHPEQVRLCEQLQAAVEPRSLEAARKGITLQVACDLGDLEVRMDPQGLRRIVDNLLDNAIKFTPAGGSVRLSACTQETNDPATVTVVLEVADTGVGIARDNLDRIFDAFEREATSTETGLSGTGLGLTIVRSLVDLMGGTISVQSTKGQGSTFTVCLPCEGVCPLPSDALGQAKLPPRDNPRVLVVEDLDINRFLVETILEDEGFAVEVAVDGREAVEAVERHPLWYYDLILMDIQMPVMDGLEATRTIRALPRDDTSRLPIVALSANSREEDRRMSRQSGMNDHIAKPFDAKHLVATINSLVSSVRQAQGT